MASSGAEPRRDGRSRRGDENRRRIVAAMMRLVGAGDPSPSAEAVARVAGTALRTVFRHFQDMDGLYGEMARLKEAEIRPLLQAPAEGLDGLIRRRARLFEAMLPYKSAADLRRPWSKFLQTRHDLLVALQRQKLAEALGRSAKRDALRFEALDCALSFEAWRRLRTDQKLAPARAEAAMALAAKALLVEEGDDA